MTRKSKADRLIAALPDLGPGYGMFGPVATPVPHSKAAQLSIAVMPFATVQTDGDNRFLADGITDNLITDLSRISNTMVIGRSTMFTYRDRVVDARHVGRELDVRYVVAGKVLRAGKRITIHVELVDASTGIQIWAERIEHPADDWSAVSDIVSGRIARTLNLELMHAASRGRMTSATTAPQAAELAMRGWVELFIKAQTPESNAAALGWLNEALAIDRNLSLAWTGLAYVTYRAATFGWADYSMNDGMRRAVEFARRALDLDPRAADAYYAMGQSLNALDEMEEAQEAHKTCIALNPSHAPAYAALGQVRMFLGFPEETAGYCARAFQLSPREPLRSVWLRSRGLAALFLGDAETAATDARAAVAANPKYPSGYILLAAAEARLGNLLAAREALLKLYECSRYRTIQDIRGIQARPRCTQFMAQFEQTLCDLRAAGLPD